MDSSEAIRVAGAISPLVRDLMHAAEGSDAAGHEKHEAVLELVRSVYVGAQRTGQLKGVKELKGLEWAAVAPMADILIEGLAVLFHKLRIWLHRPVGGDG